VTLPIALVGIEAAQAIGNAIGSSPEQEAELFASAGSGASLVPPLAAVIVALVLLGLGGRVVGRSSPRLPDDPGIWLFHCHVNDHIRGGMPTRYQVLS
jgi:Multicopper oxidase